MKKKFYAVLIVIFTFLTCADPVVIIFEKNTPGEIGGENEPASGTFTTSDGKIYTWTVSALTYSNGAGFLTPLSAENTADFTVTISGFDSDPGTAITLDFTNADNAAITDIADPDTGLQISSSMDTFSSGTLTYTVAVTLSDNKAFPAIANNISVNATGGELDTGFTMIRSLTIIDGQADFSGSSGTKHADVSTVDRRIPVHQQNVSAFNTYANTTNGLTRHYKQTSNLALTAPAGGDTSNWVAIGDNASGNNTTRFSGSYNGNGNNIANMVISISDDYQGMFGIITASAVLKNIKIMGATSISAIDFVGGIAGVNFGTVDSCSSAGNVTGTDADYAYAGGLVGQNSGTIKNSYSAGTVTILADSMRTGGVAGYNSGTIENCYATGNINGGNNVGGLAGYNSGTITNSYYTGTITCASDSELIGGVAGYNSGTIESCYATGNINAGDAAGGLVGYNAGTIQKSYYIGIITCPIDSQNIGGVAGLNLNTGIIEMCYSAGSIEGGYNIGGLTGLNYFDGVIKNCYSTADVISLYPGPSMGTGGLVGVGIDSSDLENCYATGSVSSATRYTGGLQGYEAGEVQNNVALNPSVISTYNDPGTIHRVTGVTVAGYVLSNNYARDDMVIQYGPSNTTLTSVISSATGTHGEDIGSNDDQTIAFGSSWDPNVWDLPGGNFNTGAALPTLKDLPTAHTQNPTMP